MHRTIPVWRTAASLLLKSAADTCSHLRGPREACVGRDLVDPAHGSTQRGTECSHKVLSLQTTLHWRSNEASHWHRRHLLQGEGRACLAGLVQASPWHRRPGMG